MEHRSRKYFNFLPSMSRPREEFSLGDALEIFQKYKQQHIKRTKNILLFLSVIVIPSNDEAHEKNNPYGTINGDNNNHLSRLFDVLVP